MEFYLEASETPKSQKDLHHYFWAEEGLGQWLQASLIKPYIMQVFEHLGLKSEEPGSSCKLPSVKPVSVGTIWNIRVNLLYFNVL